MGRVSISKAKEEKVINYYKKVCSLCKLNSGGGISWGGSQDYKLETNLDILSDLIKIRGYDFKKTKNEFIINIIKKLKITNNYRIDYIKQELEDEIIQYEKIPIKDYYIAFQFIINPKYFPRKYITIDNQRFIVKSQSDFFNNFEYPDVNKYPGFKDVFDTLKNNHIILYGKFKGRDIPSIYEKANNKFDLIRGFYSLAMKYQSVSMHFGRPKPQSIIPLPKLYLIYDKNKKFESFYYNLGDYTKSSIKPTRERIDLFLSFLRDYNKSDNKYMKELFQNALLAYTSSLDQDDSKHSFLHLWQVLEFIALKDESTTEKKVIKRINSLIIDPSEELGESLESAYSKRNMIAHEILHIEIDQRDINFLDTIVKLCLTFLLEHLSKFNNRFEMEYFYDNIIKENTIDKIEKKKKLNEYIIKCKQREKKIIDEYKKNNEE